MIKQYCDRCGKEVEIPKVGILYRHVYYGEIWLDSLRTTVTEKSITHTLCSACEDDFIDWFQNPPREDYGPIYPKGR